MWKSLLGFLGLTAAAAPPPGPPPKVQALARIERWMTEHAEAEPLPGPADPKAVAAAEKQWGHPFPSTLRALYLAHDGMKDRLPRAAEVPPIGFALDHWRQETDEWPKMKPYWPMALGDGDLWIAADGSVVRGGIDGEPGPVAAPDLSTWLTRHADALESGDLVWHPHFREIVPKEELPDDQQLARLVAEANGVGLAEGAAVVAAAGRQLRARMALGEKAELPPLGHFSVSKRRAFTGTDPNTGQPVAVPARWIAVFRAGPALKAGLNGGEADWTFGPAPDWIDAETFAALAAAAPAISATLARGEGVAWPNTGQFTVSVRRAFRGANPTTGQPMEVPERKIPVFRAYAELTEAMQPAQ